MVSNIISSLAKILQTVGKPFFLILLKSIESIFYFFYHFSLLNKKNFVLMILLGFASAAVLYAYFFVTQIVYSLPSPDSLAKRQIATTSKIYDRNGYLLYSVYRDENRTLIKQSDIPQQVKLATLAAEDANFYSHSGFSVRGMSRAFMKFVTEGKITGGSTITQQLIKNTLLTPEQTLLRKSKELLLAILVERKYSKDEILTMYLNEVSYGGTAYGIKAAANVYFDKEVNELSISESALLAGLTKSPTLLSPFGNNKDDAIDRGRHIVDLMYQRGFITETQMKNAKSESITFNPNVGEIHAPHFVMMAREWLAKKYGEDMLTQSGLSIRTTLDYSMQRLLEESINSELEKISNMNVSNAAGVVIDVNSGEVLALAGSKNYFDKSIDGNVNVALMPRQPGSSIKPLNYILSFQNKLSPADKIIDAPSSFFIDKSQPVYKPVNYDGKYRGQITLRSALAESRNIPAVKLLEKNGVDNMITLGKSLGITTWDDKNRFGLSLTLGGGEVKLIDLAQMYQVFANSGTKTQIAFIKEVEDIEQNKIYIRNCEVSMNCEKENIIDNAFTYMLTDILSDNKARTPAFGPSSALVIKDHPEVAVKTGTSNDLRDNITIGYNQDYLVAIWVGNNDNSPMSRVASGITGASPIWNSVMTNLLKDKQSVAWKMPDSVIASTACGTNDQDIYLKELAPQSCIATIDTNRKTKEFIAPGQQKKNNKNIN